MDLLKDIIEKKNQEITDLSNRAKEDKWKIYKEIEAELQKDFDQKEVLLVTRYKEMIEKERA